MDNDNTISRILRGIGIAIISIGILTSLILGDSEDEISIAIGGIVGSIISGMLFIGFSEILKLLQQSVDNQEQIIRQLKEKPSAVMRDTNSINGNQSSNKSSSEKHLFRCDNCGKMIEGYPCCECGFKFN